jgi:hypothetical protein
MKPAHIGLWAIGAVMCAISIGLLFDASGRGNRPSPIGEAPNSAQELAASVTEETSLRDELDVLDPAARHSSHAIVPDMPQVTAPSPPGEATAPSTDLPTPQATAPSADLPKPQATAPSADSPSPQLPSAHAPVKEASPSVTSQPLAPAHPIDEPAPTMPKEELVTITSAATYVTAHPPQPTLSEERTLGLKLVLRRPTPDGHKFWTLHQGIRGGSSPAFWRRQVLLRPLPRTSCLMWRRLIFCQKSSVLRPLKTGLRQLGQSTPPKRNDIERNIIMDAAGSLSGS